MYNEVYKIVLPLISGTNSIQGSTGSSDVLTYDSQTPNALAGTGTSTYTQLIQNENSTLTYKIWDWATNTRVTYNLPSLSSSNAIEYINRINSVTAAFDGVNILKTSGDFTNAPETNMFIFGSSGNDQIAGPTSGKAVATIYGGIGNDDITGSGFYSILDGGSGTNSLHGLSGSNYFRMYTGDGGYSTIIADRGSDSRLQIYVNGTNAINTTQLWDLKRVGDDLQGFVKDPNGGTSSFTIKNQFTSNPVDYFNIYETGTSGAYLGAGLTDSATGNYQIFAGTDFSDTINLTNFQKSRAYIFGNAGADTVFSKNGITLRFYNDINDQVDTVVYDKSSTNYTINTQFLASGAISTNVTPQNASISDYLSNVERLQFSDTSVALDYQAGGHAGQAYRLYLGVLGRQGEPGGLGYVMNRLDQGETLKNVASGYLNSPEFQAKYGNADQATFINLLYKNILGRVADSGGTTFINNWIAGGATREDVTLGFTESPEYIAQCATLIGNNGIHYTPVV